MMPQIKREADGSLTVSVNITLNGSMLEMEEDIARAVNAVGRTATAEALRQFDSDGTPLVRNKRRHTSKGTQKKSTRRRME